MVIVTWMLGCTGATEVIPDPAAATPDDTVVQGHTRPESVAGSWRMIPDERKLRELKIIDAAASGKEGKLQRLGELSPEEQALFNGWVGSKGKQLDKKLDELKRLRSYQV